MEKTRQNLASVVLAVFDFDGVFTDNSVFVNEDGIESVRCFRSDGIGLKRINDLNVKTLIISSEKSKLVQTRSEKLNIDCISNVEHKDVVLRNYSKKNNIPLSKVLYLGNDINDIDVLKIVGYPFVVRDSFNEVLEYACFQTRNKGGYGAVREVCDYIFNDKKNVNV